MRKSLFRYKLCKKRINIKIKLLEALSLIRLNKQHIQELERKLVYIEYRIANLEYFMEKIEEYDAMRRKQKRTILKFLTILFNNQYMTLIIRILIAIMSIIFILEWAEEQGIRNDILQIMLGVING